MAKKLVSISPHVASNESTKRIMLDVLIALIPATIAGVIFFGFYSLLVVILSVCSTMMAELVFTKLTKKQTTLPDLSAAVSGLILGLNLPPYVPFYVPIIGGFFAILIVKMLFGGLGRNFANPAATARVFLLIALGAQMTKFYPPLNVQSFGDLFFFPSIDTVIQATPLSPGGTVGLFQVILGNVSGSIGETSALALIIGGAYLSFRKVIDPKIPLVIIAMTFGLLFIFGQTPQEALYGIFAGGLMLGAIFMATDYATSPNTGHGRLIYCGLIALVTSLIRVFGSYPEGMSLAIIFANLFVPLIDKLIIPKPFGGGKDLAKSAINILVLGFTVATVAVAVFTHLRG